MELRAFVTNLGKYNEGELVGKWVDFPIDEDVFAEILEEIGVDGETYEEWFFTDYDCPIDLGLGEYVSLDDLNEAAEALAEWDEDEAEAVADVFGVDQLLVTTRDDYMFYNVDNDRDLGYEVAETAGYLEELPEFARRYFDYEAFGRDFRIEADGGYSNNGYFVERI